MKFAAFSTPFMEYSMQESMKKIAELGFDGVEIGCREPHLSADTSIQRVKEMKELANALGLEIPALGGYAGNFSVIGDKECEAEFDQIKRLLEHAAVLKAGMLRVLIGGPNAFIAEEYHYAKSAHWLNRCAEEADQYGIQIAIEIHNCTLVETAENAMSFLHRIEQENVGFIHDAGNMYITDTDFGQHSVDVLGKHLLHVHIKDEKRVSQLSDPGTFSNLTRHGEENFQHCLLGEGAADHQPLLKALKNAGYNEWITMETAAPVPLEERMKHDLEMVKSMLDLNNYKREL